MNDGFGDADSQKYGIDHLDSSTGNAETDVDNASREQTIKDIITLDIEGCNCVKRGSFQENYAA
jgi:hypothetical protein